MDYCPNFNKIAWTRTGAERSGAPQTGSDLRPLQISRASHTVLIARLRCKQWSCEYCAAKNQAIWRGFLHRKLPEISQNWYLMTLTAHSRQRSHFESYKNLQHGIDVMMKRMRRVWKTLQYVRVYEKHPTSEALHCHFIISDLTRFVVHGVYKNSVSGFIGVLERPYREGCWSLSTYVKNAAHAAKMGYIADIKPIDNLWTVWYITKYLTKAAQEIDIGGLRHVQTTQGIGSPHSDSAYDWTVSNFVTARDFNAGDALLDVTTGEFIEPDYWADNDVYPPVLK